MISVNHTLVYYNHQDELGTYYSINTPKTDAGKREIPIVEGVREAFEMERKYQEENGIVSKSRIDGYEDFIFVNRNGEVQHQGTLNKALKRIIQTHEAAFCITRKMSICSLPTSSCLLWK